jgi:hypothetical protein
VVVRQTIRVFAVKKSCRQATAVTSTSKMRRAEMKAGQIFFSKRSN